MSGKNTLSLSGLAAAGITTAVTASILVAVQPAMAAPATIPVGSNPIAMAYDASSHTAYVANDGSVSVVDTKTNTQTSEFKTGWQGQGSIALARNDSELLIGTNGRKNLKVVDIATQKVVDKIAIGKGATAIAVAGKGKKQRAFVASDGHNSLFVIKTWTNAIVKKYTFKHSTQSATTSPDGREVWIGSQYNGHIWVLNAKTGDVKRSIKVSNDKVGPVNQIAFAPAGQKAWIAGLGGVDVIRAKSGKVVKYLSDARLFPANVANGSLNLEGVALSNNGSRAIVLNATYPQGPVRGNVVFVDTKTFKNAGRVKLGVEPTSVTVAGRTTYATNFMDDTLSYFPTPNGQ